SRLQPGGESNFHDQLDHVFALSPRLKGRRRQAAGTLSGGVRQMLAVGRALMGKPDLLMLAEPSLGLAPLIVKEIFHIISALRGTGVATLLIEQNARAALQISDHGYVLETGEFALEGPEAELAQKQREIVTYPGLAKTTACLLARGGGSGRTV
ncbi:ABC transporter ATP-binding protein, partial [Burkholderia cenocepacia]